MELPSTGEVVAVFLAFWAGMLIWLGVRAFRESKQQHLERQAVIGEVANRARARGRRFTKGTGEIDWIVEGTLPDGEAWTLTCRAEFRGARRDTISGHSLKWQAPAIRRDRPAFRFDRRSTETPRGGTSIEGNEAQWRQWQLVSEDAGLARRLFDTLQRPAEKAPPGELNLEGNEVLWRRWRLVAQDAALARRVFDAAICALLEKLPPPFASNTCEDERTSIVLGPGGLEFVLGVYNPGADLVDLSIVIGEAIADREKDPGPGTS